jgi:hypothetical protein
MIRSTEPRGTRGSVFDFDFQAGEHTPTAAQEFPGKVIRLVVTRMLMMFSDTDSLRV